LGEKTDAKAGDELLDKLDQLLKRHRPVEGGQPVPTLAPATATDDIPVLTDAVSGPGLARNASAAPPRTGAPAETRLNAAIGREIGRLQAEMPQYSQQLAMLSATLSAAVRLLVRRHLGEERAEDPRLDEREPRL
jgi:hypothetical protein